MDARAARVHAALQLQHSLEALRADFDARFGDLAEKRTTTLQLTRAVSVKTSKRCSVV